MKGILHRKRGFFFPSNLSTALHHAKKKEVFLQCLPIREEILSALKSFRISQIFLPTEMQITPDFLRGIKKDGNRKLPALMEAKKKLFFFRLKQLSP